MYITTTGC